MRSAKRRASSGVRAHRRTFSSRIFRLAGSAALPGTAGNIEIPVRNPVDDEALLREARLGRDAHAAPIRRCGYDRLPILARLRAGHRDADARCRFRYRARRRTAASLPRSRRALRFGLARGLRRFRRRRLRIPDLGRLDMRIRARGACAIMPLREGGIGARDHAARRGARGGDARAAALAARHAHAAAEAGREPPARRPGAPSIACASVKKSAEAASDASAT